MNNEKNQEKILTTKKNKIKPNFTPYVFLTMESKDLCEISEVLKNELFVSNFMSANNINLLTKKGITHILNLSGHPLFVKTKLKFTCLCINDIKDNRNENIIEKYLKNKDFILEVFNNENNKEKKNCILINCNAGCSRSAAFCISYLMEYKNKTLLEAYSQIFKNRKYTSPNIGFIKQLIEFEYKLYNKNSIMKYFQFGLNYRKKNPKLKVRRLSILKENIENVNNFIKTSKLKKKVTKKIRKNANYASRSRRNYTRRFNNSSRKKTKSTSLSSYSSFKFKPKNKTKIKTKKDEVEKKKMLISTIKIKKKGIYKRKVKRNQIGLNITNIIMKQKKRVIPKKRKSITSCYKYKKNKNKLNFNSNLISKKRKSLNFISTSKGLYNKQKKKKKRSIIGNINKNSSRVINAIKTRNKLY